MTTDATPQPIGPDDRRGPLPERDHLVRSEEQLHIRAERVVAGYARLEKFTVTETKTITVEVTHEEVRLVHRAADGSILEQPEASQTAHDRWMVLSREEVVVSKRVVPVERVRLEVFPVVEQREVTEQVRKEQIDALPLIENATPQDSAPPS